MVFRRGMSFVFDRYYVCNVLLFIGVIDNCSRSTEEPGITNFLIKELIEPAGNRKRLLHQLTKYGQPCQGTAGNCHCKEHGRLCQGTAGAVTASNRYDLARE